MARAAFILFAFLCLLAGILSSRIERGAGLAGRWEGELLTSAGPEDVVLNLLHEGGEHAGSLELPEGTLQLTDILFRGDSIRLQLNDGISVRALLKGADMVGVLQMNGERQPLTLHRISPDSRGKPWSMKSTRLFRKLGKVQGLFDRRQTSAPTAAIAPI